MTINILSSMQLICLVHQIDIENESNTDRQHLFSNNNENHRFEIHSESKNDIYHTIYTS